MSKLKSSRRKSRKPRKFHCMKRSAIVKSRSKKSDGAGKCLKWVKIPKEEMESYEAGIKK